MYAFEEAKRSKMVNFMSMAMGSRATVFLLPTLFWLGLSSDTCNGVASDIQCLKDLKASLIDPNGYLSSWNFDNMTEAYICKFYGIECWHNDENKVLNIQLPKMGVKGRFPVALKNCTSMTGLDLSTNDLFGPLPDNIGSLIPYVTTLDLSYNNFTGVIPDSLGNCSYLNTLSLQNNRLTGQIPWQLGRLDRLSQFNVANNSLSGPIPPFYKRQSILAISFANNTGLCGTPLDVVCRGPVKKSHTSVINTGGAIGGIVLSVIIIGVILLFSFRKVSKKKKEEEVEGNKWAKSIKGTKGIKVRVSTFEKFVPKMRLIDLMKATDNFSKDNIISSGRVGTMYKGVLPDGSFIAVKRMEDSHRSIKRFISETTVLGSIQHRNVIPLLGFCIARKERLLVYKYMSRGTLYQQLYKTNCKANVIEWPLRLRIAIGVAKGLVWLHHNCNPCIIHYNITSKHILLDEEYEPVISNFKSARLMGSTINTIFGNVGYVAPEYIRMFEAIPKGDVYNFGVVLLELVTGNEPTRATRAPRNLKGNLVQWIAFLSNNSCLSDAIDKLLIGMGHDDDIFEFIRIACSCVVSDPDKRPTMFEVYRLLQAIGKRDGFIDEDEIQMPPNTIDTDYAYLITMPQQILKIH
ncbi:probably inactive leucine-rich repeat receptor-like protein kinase At5g48380 [Magnolia sinica]|uniref:probably inactive leucine-rich repeat receptor-like protein kinase At5g48380 n=1 Tax=Magnolia sinica TaxID=86752 RepID=UPI00265A1292|nr:probably inactive leucine-rich repeat receptor-like protein kinase At5g48380 [Magnolia sinica]